MDQDLIEEEVYFVDEDENSSNESVDLDEGGDEEYYEDGFGEEGNYSDE